MTKCLSVYCDRDSVAKGLCSKHHGRMMKGQDINIKTWQELTEEENFLNKVKKNQENDCWIWTGGRRGYKRTTTSNEYGVFGFRGKNEAAHRVSWILWRQESQEPIIKGLCVCHKCDNPLCVNPEHLFLGTAHDNMRDKISKNRCPQKNKTHCCLQPKIIAHGS